MRKTFYSGILGIIFLLVLGCKKDDIYQRPPWLAGKLFSQIEAKPELSTFAEAIRMVGYDSVINVSGSFTVFAPNNDAFDLFFESHPVYNSLEDIPLDELSRIVKFHIVQNPWSIEQLHQLDVNGWIDTTDLDNDEPRGFKRETLLRDPNIVYGVKNSKDPVLNDEERKLIIVDSSESGWLRRQSTDSRKYAPFFYDEYLDIYDLNSDDYAFYFSRPFESSNTYFVGGLIVDGDIFAENGFVHIIDRVIEPLKSAYQILSDETDANSYNTFLSLVNNFPSFSYSEQKTEDQPGYDQGLEVDSLFDISYPDLTFAILNERTSAPSGTSGLPSNVTVRYQHGLIAPTDEAMAQFVSEYFTGSTKWGSLDRAPVHVRRMIVNTHMSYSSLYPSNFDRGFYNGEEDLITLDQSTIVQKQYGSNCTFVGVNSVVVPKAFTGVTGPVYLQRGYSRVMYAIERAGLLPALKRSENEYMFFVEKDANLSLDSSLIYYPATETFQIYQLVAGQQPRPLPTTTTDIRNLLLNHIGIRQATGIPRKEFIKNMAGNYIVVNNITHEVRGTAATTFGIGGEPVTVVPTLLYTADNGTSYDITHWFNFTEAALFGIIQTAYPEFHALLTSAGLADQPNFRYTFTSPDEYYTVFVPNAAALDAYPYELLTTEQLRKFLMMHFVQGDLIFTDGYAQPGYYETSRIDEKSTQYTRVYTKLYINPVVDGIEFRANDGSTYLSVSESSVTNRTAARTLVTGTHPTIVTNGVIHEIDRVFDFNEMDVE